MKKFVFAFAFIFININTATLSQLDQLAGIGPKYAQGIIDARPFSSVDDLTRVKGIGPKTLQKIKDQGYACVNCTTTQEAPQAQQAPPEAEISQTPNAAEALNAIVAYPSGIFINEILPSPQGADETDEFIEIFNSNDSDIDLSGWILSDKEGTVTNFTIPKNTQIKAGSYLVFYRPQTKIMLNNDSDSVLLSSPDKKTVDSVSFGNAPTGQSYNKNSSAWAWSVSPTPGFANSITAKAAAKALPKAKKNVNNNISKTAAADLTQILEENQATEKPANPWFLFSAVSAVSAVLAAIVLIIKLRIKPI